MGASLQSEHEHHLSAPGRTIAYSVRGDGPLLFLIHGWPQTRRCWRNVAPALSESFTVVTPDLRGYGESVADPGLGFDKRSVLEDLRLVLDELGATRAHVVGHDRGGRVAHRWALDHPDEVGTLTVLDVIPTLEVVRTLDANAAASMWHWFFHAQPDLPEVLLEGRIEAHIDRFLAGPAAVGAIDPVTRQHYLDAFASQGPHGWLGDYRASLGVDLEHHQSDERAGREVSSPVLALWGDAAALGGVDVLGAWRRHACEVSGRALEGCGHYVPEERPDQVIEAIVGHAR